MENSWRLELGNQICFSRVIMNESQRPGQGYWGKFIILSLSDNEMIDRVSDRFLLQSSSVVSCGQLLD